MSRIYLDANATTPVLPEVVEAMLPWFTTTSGNPSSAHQPGQRARGAVEQARFAVAALLHATPHEVVFTSGGTESNNLALCGVLQPYLDRGEPVHLITTAIEHHAVLYPAEALARRGLELTVLQPNSEGIVEPDALRAALRPHTRLVSIMLANNETGTIQPLGKLARIAKEHNPALLVHSDGVQAAGKLPLDMGGAQRQGEFKNVDLLSLSGHKFYAPQGTGVLYVRAGVELTPLQLGGPHERNRRAGTENVPGIVALGRAAQLAAEWLGGDGPQQLAALRDQLEQGLLAAVPGTVVNGSTTQRTANTTNLRFPAAASGKEFDAETLLFALDMEGIAASFGSACQSGASDPSHVLVALGLTAGQARSSLRFSLSRHTTADEITRAVEIIARVLLRQQGLA